MPTNTNGKRKKRIAMMIPDLHYGGVERVAGDLSRLFCENGYQVIFFLGVYDKQRSFPHSGIIRKVDYYSEISSNKSFIWNLPKLMKLTSSLKKLKREYRIDISISFHSYINMLNILSKGKEHVILTVHEVTSVNARNLKYFYYDKFVYKSLYKRADKVISVSEYCKQDLCRCMGMLNHNIQVINNIVDAARIDREIQEELPVGTENVIVTVGRLEADKQQWHILHAFKEVLSYYPDALLIIVGEGILKKYLCDMAEKLGINKNVIFTGYQKNVGKYLKKSKMLVFSSETEALPCAIAEALYVGVPVVAADCKGGIREMLSEQPLQKKKTWQYVDGGILVPEQKGRYLLRITEEEKEMAKAMIELLGNKEKWNMISEKCFQLSEKYRRSNIEEQWIQLFKEMEGK